MRESIDKCEAEFRLGKIITFRKLIGELTNAIQGVTEMNGENELFFEPKLVNTHVIQKAALKINVAPQSPVIKSARRTSQLIGKKRRAPRFTEPIVENDEFLIVKIEDKPKFEFGQSQLGHNFGRDSKKAVRDSSHLDLASAKPRDHETAIPIEYEICSQTIDAVPLKPTPISEKL